MNKLNLKLLFCALLIGITAQIVFSQTTAFTYQGRLTDSMSSGNGNYLMEFHLFAASSGGTAIDTLTNVPVTVTNNIFTVQLNFTAANAFDGSERFLEIAVKRNVSESYTILMPRQPISATPYSIRALNATTADTSINTLNVGGTSAAQIIKEGDTRLSDSRQPTAGSGNYIQNQTVIAQTSAGFSIDGTGAANIFNAMTQFNIGGNRFLSGAGANNIFAGRFAGDTNSSGTSNSFFGYRSGLANTTGSFNSFFGMDAGGATQTGSNNTFVGYKAGLGSQTGSNNTTLGSNTTTDVNVTFATAIGAGANVAESNSVVLGRTADTVRVPGKLNVTGDFSSPVFSSSGINNIFLGKFAGAVNTTGSNNSYFGANAGLGNQTGSNNSALGFQANFGNEGLSFATAIGAGAVASASNTVVLGRGADTVQIPGNLNVTGTFNFSGANLLNLNATNITSGTLDNVRLGVIPIANGGTGSTTQNFVDLTTAQTITGNKTFSDTISGNIINAATQFNIGGNRAFSATAGTQFNTFAGLRTGATGVSNSFFGFESGFANSSGNNNSFFGRHAGVTNTTGNTNSFFGVNAGLSNTTGNENVFLGVQAGNSNTTGSNNTIVGAGANVGANNLTFATAIGAGAVVSSSNTIVLGRAADTVQIHGTLNIVGTFTGNVTTGGTLSGSIVNANTQYNLGGNRVLSIAGTNNLFAGVGAGENNTGILNSFFGASAGAGNSSGTHNSFFGNGAGPNNTTGAGNLFVGVFAGANNTTGSNNTIIGTNAFVSSGNLQFATAIGAQAVVSSNNTIALGRDSGVDKVVIYGLGSGGSTQLCRNSNQEISFCSSSLRYKTNIAPFNFGLNLVNRLQPITFDWKTGGLRDLGLGAEDVAAIEPLLVTYNKDGQVEGVKYDRIGVVLLNAVKEQQTQIETQARQLEAQKLLIEELKKLVCASNPNAAVCK